ncbi:MAG: spondin domain-containing protein [Pseudomonadota bacterium]
MTMKTLSRAALAAVLVGGPVHAVEITVSITNLTHGMYFTPRLLIAHTGAVDLFEAGTPASAGLTAIAEGGDTSVTANALDAGFASAQRNQTFGGLLAPSSTSADYTFETNDHPYLSLATMLVPTNDAFAGLDSWRIPTAPGTYTVNLNAYDAGTEANDEINSGNTTLTGPGGAALGGTGVPGMATPPPTQAALGSGASGVAIQAAGGIVPDTGAEGAVHIHRNALGDADPSGGQSDLDATVHRWLNPVARMTITIANGG